MWRIEGEVEVTPLPVVRRVSKDLNHLGKVEVTREPLEIALMAAYPGYVFSWDRCIDSYAHRLVVTKEVGGLLHGRMMEITEMSLALSKQKRVEQLITIAHRLVKELEEYIEQQAGT